MRFGGLVAVDDVSFRAEQKQITALIGPNGAGKTTLFNCLTGFYRPPVGRMRLHRPEGHVDLEQLDDHRIARAGVARTFQNIRLFPTLSVLENLLVAQHNRLMRASAYTVGALLAPRRYRLAERKAVEFSCRWLERIGLVAQADQPAGSLAYGDQRRLEIVRAMCTRPVLLCLDEPAAGLNPAESAQLNGLLAAIRDEHSVGVLLIEHDMSVVMKVSDHVVVLDYGKKIAAGTPAEIRRDPAVLKAYLGEDAAEPLPPQVAQDVAPSLPAADLP